MAYFRINTARTSLNWFNAVEDRRSILVIAIKRTCKHEVSSFAGTHLGRLVWLPFVTTFVQWIDVHIEVIP